MNEPLLLYSAVTLWGIVLGLFYFGGLWLTVKRLPSINKQALWMMGSFISRNLLVAAGFYPVVLHGWQFAVFCLLGFIAGRLILSRRLELKR